MLSDEHATSSQSKAARLLLHKNNWMILRLQIQQKRLQFECSCVYIIYVHMYWFKYIYFLYIINITSCLFEGYLHIFMCSPMLRYPYFIILVATALRFCQFFVLFATFELLDCCELNTTKWQTHYEFITLTHYFIKKSNS